PSRSRRCRGDPEPGVGPAMAPRTHAEEPTLVQPDTQPSSQSAIQPGDRLSTVLARDERLLDVLVAAAPTLETLRNASLRKNMTPRVTVEQAARIAGIEATDLVARLNGALAAHPQPARTTPEIPATPVPEALRALSPESLVDVDVREDLRAGIEPFARIMSA